MSNLIKIHGGVRAVDVTSENVIRQGYNWQDLMDENNPVIRRYIVEGVETILEPRYGIIFSVTDFPEVYHYFEKGMLKRWRERGGEGNIRQVFSK